MPTETINLGDKGLTDGDDIGPYLADHFIDGVEVRIPPGTYRYDGTGLSKNIGDAALIGSDEGVEFHRPPDPEVEVRPFLKCTDDVRVENITVRGEKGEAQSRWRFDAVNPAAVVDVVNVNHPDGTVGCSDSLAFYTGKYHTGTVTYKNCYVADHGNSSFYINQGYSPDRQNPVNMINCVVINANGTSRHGTNGSVIKDCTFIWRDEPNPWKNCSSMARGPRWDQGGENMVVENCHFYFGSGIGNSEGAIKVEDFQLGGIMRDIYIHNETDGEMFVDAGGLNSFNFENIHISGPGLTDSSNVMVTGSEPPDLRNEDAVWMPEAATVLPDGGSVTKVDDVTAGSLFTIMSESAGKHIEYRFTADGPVHRDSDPDRENASSVDESNVSIQPQDDGTYVVTGKTGNNYGDAFRVEGTITAFERVSGESAYTLYLDGAEMVAPTPTNGTDGTSDSGDGTSDGSGGLTEQEVIALIDERTMTEEDVIALIEERVMSEEEVRNLAVSGLLERISPS